jgi:signal transduction histidine kinase
MNNTNNTTEVVNNKATSDIIRKFLNKTLNDIMFAIKAECGSLFLFDCENKDLILDSLNNSCQLPAVKGLKLKVGEGVSGKVAGMKTPVLVRDIDVDPRFKKNGYTHYQTKSFISIPLFSARGLIGLMNLADKSNKEPFSEKDFNFAVLISRYACLNIDHLINEKEVGSDTDKQKVALEKYASVGKLATGIVHEINNPLDGITRYANMLIVHLESNSLAREYLMEIKRGLSRIGSITRSLLDFAYTVNSNSSISKTTRIVNVNEAIEESLDMLSNRMPSNIVVRKNYQKDLPDIQDFGLSHVMSNLIKNSLDAMPNGGTLDITTELNCSALKISVNDTGCGISKDVVDKIFEPFFTTKSIDKGTGLGLSICNEIVKKYGGNIRVESTEGKGTNITVFIPK